MVSLGHNKLNIVIISKVEISILLTLHMPECGVLHWKLSCYDDNFAITGAASLVVIMTIYGNWEVYKIWSLLDWNELRPKIHYEEKKMSSPFNILRTSNAYHTLSTRSSLPNRSASWIKGTFFIIIIRSTPLTHWSRVMHICISKINHH